MDYLEDDLNTRSVLGMADHVEALERADGCAWDCSVNHVHRLDAAELDKRQRYIWTPARGWHDPRTARCVECGRVFDLTDERDAAEWSTGHDCEA